MLPVSPFARHLPSPHPLTHAQSNLRKTRGCFVNAGRRSAPLTQGVWHRCAVAETTEGWGEWNTRAWNRTLAVAQRHVHLQHGVARGGHRRSHCPQGLVTQVPPPGVFRPIGKDVRRSWKESCSVLRKAHLNDIGVCIPFVKQSPTQMRESPPDTYEASPHNNSLPAHPSPHGVLATTPDDFCSAATGSP